MQFQKTGFSLGNEKIQFFRDISFALRNAPDSEFFDIDGELGKISDVFLGCQSICVILRTIISSLIFFQAVIGMVRFKIEREDGETGEAFENRVLQTGVSAISEKGLSLPKGTR